MGRTAAGGAAEHEPAPLESQVLKPTSPETLPGKYLC